MEIAWKIALMIISLGTCWASSASSHNSTVGRIRTRRHWRFDDTRVSKAICILRCLKDQGAKNLYIPFPDPRGVYAPVYTCPEKSVFSCPKCVQGCPNGSPNAISRQKLSEDQKLELSKPSLHCRSWAPMTDENRVVDPEAGLAPAIYFKYDVVDSETGLEPKVKQSVAFLIDLRMVLAYNDSTEIWSEWVPVPEVATEGMRPFEGMTPGKTYQIRVSGITDKYTYLPSVISDPIQATVHPDWYFKPEPPSLAKIYDWIRTNDSDNRLKALMLMEPNYEYSCSYEMHYSRQGSQSMMTWFSEPYSAYFAILDKMEFSSQYTFRIRAKNPLGKTESVAYIYKVESPSCLEVYAGSFEFCPPPPPTNVSAAWDGEDLKINWSLPLITSRDNRIEVISVHLLEEPFPSGITGDYYFDASLRSPRYGINQKQSLPGNATSTVFTSLSQTSAYKIWVRAESTGGESEDSSIAQVAAKRQPQIFSANGNNNNFFDPLEMDTHASQAAGAGVTSTSAWIVPTTVLVVLFVLGLGIVYVCRKSSSHHGPMQMRRSVVGVTPEASFVRVAASEHEYTDHRVLPKKWFSFRKVRPPGLDGHGELVGDEVLHAGYVRPAAAGSRLQNLRFFGERMILSSLLSLSPPDDYEVSWDQLILQEVLGEGAFGVVRKAHLKLNKKNRAQLVEQAALPESRTRHHHLPHRSKAGIEVVAVKMLKDGAGLEEYQQLKNEMEVLKMINHHPNVVGILGAVTQTRPMALIVEHCPFGDLHTQLRRMAEKMELEKARKIAEATERKGIVYTEFRCNASDSSGYEGCESETSSPPSTPPLNIPAGSAMVHNELYEGSLDNPQLVINSGGENIVCENYEVAIDNAPQNAVDEMRTPSDLLSIARQIAAGMEYLSKNKVVHRDLAARNILLFRPKHVKISDFGLSRDVYARNLYERTSNGKVPIRWMAPESIMHQLYTTKSDVWSFGILLWEIATLGGVPYPGVSVSDLHSMLQSGYKMPKPTNCSSDFYSLMVECWKLPSAERPFFTDLKVSLDKMLEDSTTEEYLTLNPDPVPREDFD